MFCTECGQPLEPGDKFCASCGTRSRGAVPAAAPAIPIAVRTPQSTAEIVRQSSFKGTSTMAAAPVPAREVQPPPVEPIEQRIPEAPRVVSQTAAVTPPSSNPLFPEPSEPVHSPSVVPAQIRTCPHCGRASSSDAMFCEGCGSRFDSQQEPVAETSPEFDDDPHRYLAVEPPASPRMEPVTSVEPPVAHEGRRSSLPPTAYDLMPYADEPPAKRKAMDSGTKVLWIVVAVVLLLGLAAIVWMLRSSSHPAAASTTGEVTVTLAPALAQVVTGNAVDLTATVNGTSVPQVTWSIQEGPTAGQIVTRGVISKDGHLSIPAVYVAPSNPGVYHVVATSQADPSKTAVSEVTVNAATK